MLYVLEGVTYRYAATQPPALREVSCAIPEGAVTAIIGPNGAGKSTLLKLLGRRLLPHTGHIRYRGRPIERYTTAEWGARIAWLPQQVHIPFPMRVHELVRLGRWPRYRAWFDRVEDRAVIEGVLHTLGIAHLAHRWLHTLSGGEQQLVHLARALAQDPETLLLDEPLTFLDLRHAIAMMDVLHRRTRERGTSVIVILHDLNMVSHYCDWVILLADATVRSVGPPEEVLRYPLLKAAFGTDVYIDINTVTRRLIIVPLPEWHRNARSEQ